MDIKVTIECEECENPLGLYQTTERGIWVLKVEFCEICKQKVIDAEEKEEE